MDFVFSDKPGFNGEYNRESKGLNQSVIGYPAILLNHQFIAQYQCITI